MDTEQRFTEALGEQPAGSERPDDPWAVIELILSTPMSPSATPDSVANWFEWQRQVAAERAATVRKLARAGWQMDRPTLACDAGAEQLALVRVAVGRLAFHESDQDGYLDIVFRFRKRFAKPEHAEREVAELSLPSIGNWNFAFNEDSDGEVEWRDAADE